MRSCSEKDAALCMELASKYHTSLRAKSVCTKGTSSGSVAASTSGRGWFAGALAFQLAVGIYGGYFGAGLGIMMLAALSIIGLSDIHQMNGLKNLLALCINGVAALYFVWNGMVYWPDVVVMAVGAIAGGVGGAGLARRLGRLAVRRIVIAVGLVMAVKLMLR